MNYSSVEEALQEVLGRCLSRAQARRVSTVCLALLQANSVHLTHVARHIPQRTQQDSRVRQMTRLLQAPFLTQEYVYHGLVKTALAHFIGSAWHLVIDRTTLWEGRTDRATISLNYGKRAIPLIWCCVPFGGAPDHVYTALVTRCAALVPTGVKVVFHGDTEFGSAAMSRTVQGLGWDFMLAQSKQVCFSDGAHPTPVALATLPVTKHRGCQVSRVSLFAGHQIGGINVMAFYQPHYTQARVRKREVCYLATSLPLTRGTRRLGRRRWGTEPFYRDYKSSGWQRPQSQLHHPQRREGLLVLVAVLYLWTVCLGRWLCKTGQRRQVDAKPKRHLSLARLGWDWLIHQLRCHQPIPNLLRVYT